MMESNGNNMEIVKYQDQDRFLAIESHEELQEDDCGRMLTVLNELRLQSQLTDAVVSCFDGSFRVHRAVLSASSSYFRTHFTDINVRINDSKSAKPQWVYITGMNYDMLKELIDYAYLKRCDMNKDNIFDMLTSADYLGMNSLISECTEFLENMLTPENCLKIQKFAEFRFLDNLRIKAHKYLLYNFPDVSERNRDILDLSVEEIFQILNEDFLNTKDEDLVWYLILRWIDKDPINRRCHMAKLLKAVRLGMMSQGVKYQVFLSDLKYNRYVRTCPETRQLLVRTFHFMHDLDILNPNIKELLTPKLAMPRFPHEVIFAIGGWSGGTAKAVIETYDTRADRWIKMDIEDPAGARAYHGTAVLGTEIYIVGGYDGFDYFNTCRVFDAATKSWREIAPMHSRRCYISCTQLNGFVYAIGGFDGHNRLNTVERYDPSTNQWTFIAPMHMQRSDASACTMDGRIYVTGGFNGQECLDTVEYYCPERGTWTRINNMSHRRSGVSCIGFHGFLYVMSGFNGTVRLNSCERFDPVTHTWEPISDMHHCRSNFALEIIDDMIYAIGGFNGVSTIGYTECYVEETDRWMEASDMNTVRSALTANTVYNLPNISDYLFKHRSRLLEDRRARLLSNTGIIRPNQAPAEPIPDTHNESADIEEDDDLNQSEEDDLDLDDLEMPF